MASIMKRPTAGTWEENIMWLDLRDSDVVEGVVKADIVAPLEQKIKLLNTCASLFLAMQISSDVRNLFLELKDTIALCSECISTTPMPLRDLQHRLIEIQHAYLVMKAVMDYQKVMVERNLLNDVASRPVDAKKMGAFVWNDQEAHMLYNAGLPVFSSVLIMNSNDRSLVVR